MDPHLSMEARKRMMVKAQGWIELEAFDLALEVLDAIRGPEGMLPGGGKDPEEEEMAWLLETMRAYCLKELGRFQEAAALYERFVAMEFRMEEALLGLGWCHKRLGRLDLAIQAMECLLEQDPTAPIGHYNLACYLALAGDTQRCLRELKRAFTLEPALAREATGESDFDPVRSHEEFGRILDWGFEEFRKIPPQA